MGMDGWMEQKEDELREDVEIAARNREREDGEKRRQIGWRRKGEQNA